jgi:hypothetical protein
MSDFSAEEQELACAKEILTQPLDSLSRIGNVEKVARKAG